MTDLLDAAELGSIVEGFHHRLFRMEQLPRYAVGDDYLRWAAGETDPFTPRKREWMDVLRASRSTGKQRQRVRVLSETLTDYELYSCQWGYALNSEAGEDIRVLRRGEHDLPLGLGQHDWWVTDDDAIVLMYYGDEAEFVGAELLFAALNESYLRLRDEAWNAAEPFDRWWSRHPEMHQRVAVA